MVLSSLASVLRPTQDEARILDRSQQMLLAAQIYNADGFLQIKNPTGAYVPAKYLGKGHLVMGSAEDAASPKAILSVFDRRIKPFLVNEAGERKTFEELGIDKQEYLEDNFKMGYHELPWKIVYEVLGNPGANGAPSTEVEAYVIPVNGMGLWAAIYGYIAIEPDGNSVKGISWFQHAETPGLGANISEASWQSLFPGKVLFQQDSSGNTDFDTAPLGITVVRGKVAETLGTSPKANSAVDGMAGATLTGNGVSKAYKDCLGPYRPFLLSLRS